MPIHPQKSKGVYSHPKPLARTEVSFKIEGTACILDLEKTSFYRGVKI